MSSVSSNGYKRNTTASNFVEVLNTCEVGQSVSSASFSSETISIGTTLSVGGDCTVVGDVYSTSSGIIGAGSYIIQEIDADTVTFTASVIFEEGAYIQFAAGASTSLALNAYRIDRSSVTLDFTPSGAEGYKDGGSVYALQQRQFLINSVITSLYNSGIRTVTIEINAGTLSFSDGNGSVTPEFGIGTTQASGTSATLSSTEKDVAFVSFGTLDDMNENGVSYIINPVNFELPGQGSSEFFYFNGAGNWMEADSIQISIQVFVFCMDYTNVI